MGFIIYLVVAVIIFTALFIKYRKNEYSDDDALAFIILTSIAWPVMLILIAGFAFGGFILVLIESIDEELKSKKK